MSERVPSEAIRVSDADRREVADRLRLAHDDGLIDLSEFDERTTTVWHARTRAELAGVTADLPRTRARKKHGVVFAANAGGVAMKVLTTIWACISAVALPSRGIVALSTDGPDDPWWLWVAGPPAAVLLVLYVAGAGRPPRRG